MTSSPGRAICWAPTWNQARRGVGLEHLILKERNADSVLLAVDEDDTPFRLSYQLSWDQHWQLQRADFSVASAVASHILSIETDGKGHWQHKDGCSLAALDGCLDIDVWPTPFTNTFPIRREPMAIGERRQFLMAWISAPALSIERKPQAYTRLAERLYLFESLDGSGFKVELAVDEEGIVLDYPQLFQRVGR
jgi:hypothetical protein